MTAAEINLRKLLEADPEPVGLVRLGKRLQLPMSSVLRLLAAAGPVPLAAGQPAPGWILVEQDGDRQLARLSDAGREAARS